jgi:hypothetical protein
MAASIATIAVLSACDGPSPAADDFFPLTAGLSWTYRQTTTFDDSIEKPRRELLTMSNRGADPIEGVNAMRRRSDSGIDYWLANDATGVYRVATKGPLEREPKLDPERRFVLKKPHQIGTEWVVATTTYVLARKNEVPREYRRVIKPFPMTYRIEALDESLQTDAGQFQHCMRVVGNAQVRVYDDAGRSWRNNPVQNTEWYCPRVGLVRLERKEPSPTRMMDGGVLVLELTSMRKATHWW